MKNIEKKSKIEDDLLPEYEIDYSKAIRNLYYKKDRVFIEVDADLPTHFKIRTISTKC